MVENNHPKELVERYTRFYLADRKYNPSARKSIQPLYEGCEIICRADTALRNPDTLSELVAARVSKLMAQIHAGDGALGRWVLSDSEAERGAILDFSNYLVKDVFFGAFGGELGRFSGKQRGLLEDTCEFLYRIKNDEQNKLINTRE